MPPDFVPYPDPRLGQPAHLTDIVDDRLRDIGGRLLEAAQAVEAFGLAAVHIGEVAPVVVVSMSNDQAKRDYRLLFNPTISAASEDHMTGSEGSVSLPGVRVDVSRPAWVNIDYLDEAKIAHNLHLEGLPARIAQHEIDQMNGIFFLSRVSKLKRDMALKKHAKAKRPG